MCDCGMTVPCSSGGSETGLSATGACQAFAGGELNLLSGKSGVECRRIYGWNLMQQHAALRDAADLQSYHLQIVNRLLQVFSPFPERFQKCCIARS